MQIGFIGLGRMGGNMTRRLSAAGHTVVAWDRNPDAVRAACRSRVWQARRRWTISSGSCRHRGRSGSWSRPATPTEETVNALASRLAAGDVIIDGGNTHFKDDVRRARTLAASGIDYVDVGTSGGVWGARARLLPDDRRRPPSGCGTPDAARSTALAPDHGATGYLHCGPAGAGHFVKMIHNGIEYGLMQSYAEGFDILRNADSASLPADQRYTFDLADIAEVWRHGSVVSSWLLDLTALALARRSAARRIHRHASAIPAKDAGPSPPPSRKTCPPTC